MAHGNLSLSKIFTPVTSDHISPTPPPRPRPVRRKGEGLPAWEPPRARLVPRVGAAASQGLGSALPRMANAGEHRQPFPSKGGWAHSAACSQAGLGIWVRVGEGKIRQAGYFRSAGLQSPSLPAFATLQRRALKCTVPGEGRETDRGPVGSCRERLSRKGWLCDAGSARLGLFLGPSPARPPLVEREPVSAGGCPSEVLLPFSERVPTFRPPACLTAPAALPPPVSLEDPLN